MQLIIQLLLQHAPTWRVACTGMALDPMDLQGEEFHQIHRRECTLLPVGHSGKLMSSTGSSSGLSHRVSSSSFGSLACLSIIMASSPNLPTAQVSIASTINPRVVVVSIAKDSLLLVARYRRDDRASMSDLQSRTIISNQWESYSCSHPHYTFHVGPGNAQ